MNKIGALVGIAVAVVAVWFFLLRNKEHAPSIAADPAGSAATSGSATTPTSATRTKPVDRVGKISPEERKRLADQIARARANRPPAADTGAGGAGGTPRPELAANEDANLVRTTMKDAMREIIPYLADCYDKAGDKLPAEIKVVAKLTLTGDPDIGTIIDTNGVADGDDKPLEAAFDLCLQDAFMSLQMPPLTEGSEVQVTYPFVFARNGPDVPAGSGTLPP